MDFLRAPIDSSPDLSIMLRGFVGQGEVLSDMIGYDDLQADTKPVAGKCHPAYEDDV